MQVITKSIAIALWQKEGRFYYKKEGPFDKKVRKYIELFKKQSNGANTNMKHT